MQLKCIGGKADGKLVSVHQNYNENDTVNVAAEITLSVANFDLEKAYSKVSSSVPFYSYKVTTLHFPDNLKLQFLRPSNWDAYDTVLFQLRK